MAYRILTAAAVFCLLGGAANAQGSYMTMPLGGGWSTTTTPSGDSYMTMPLGGGWSTTTGPGGSAMTMPLGGGWSTTTITPNYGSGRRFGQ